MSLIPARSILLSKSLPALTGKSARKRSEIPGQSGGARDPLSAPGRSLEGVGEILRLTGYFSVLELHDTHGKGAFPAVVDHVLADPEVAFSHDPPDGKFGWLIRVVATQRLQISAAANGLAWLWVLANNVVLIDFVFANLAAAAGAAQCPSIPSRIFSSSITISVSGLVVSR